MNDRPARSGVVQADRRAATRRRLHETENLLARLDAALAGREAGSGDELLRAACRTLAGLVARTPGSELVVSAGPDHTTSARLWLDADGELCVALARRADTGDSVTDVIPDHHHTAAALASLLWTGGLDGATVPPSAHLPQEA